MLRGFMTFGILPIIVAALTLPAAAVTPAPRMPARRGTQPTATDAGSAAGTAIAMPGGTTNDYSQTQYEQAHAAATQAGYLVGAPTFVQAGNFFFRGEKQGQNFFLTVTPDGKVYPSQPFHGVG